jgi:hypothetical protein
MIEKNASDIDKQSIVRKNTEEERLWLLLHAAHCIAERGVLFDAIKNNLKILFQFSQVSGIINDVFKNVIISPCEGLHELRSTNLFYFDYLSIIFLPSV